jgi:RNA-directed DNA polymerase
MKRRGQLMAAIADPENLREAFLKAVRGKRGKTDCRAFQERLDENLTLLREELLAGSVRVGDYHLFQIFDPKERTICAASFRQRVLHHAVMAVCEPALERAAVFDSYACRKGKGRLAAVERASGYARRHDWFLKMDVRKYFATIDHRVLERLLERRYKDPAVLGLFGKIIRSYDTAPGRGLPIGNLTSQHFANYYLAPLDRFIKERLGRGAYVRYMDDFVVWGGCREELKAVRDRVREFLAVELKLELKAEPPLNRTALGMDFLGYRLFPRVVWLARRSKLRFARKLRGYERAFLEGWWCEAELQQRTTALLAFVMGAESRGFRRHVLERFGVAAIGLEPRDPRRQLEQQRQELPVSEPQQQQPVQQEQQHWVPGCPGPSSTGAPEGALADPAAIPSYAKD